MERYRLPREPVSVELKGSTHSGFYTVDHRSGLMTVEYKEKSEKVQTLNTSNVEVLAQIVLSEMVSKAK